MEKRRTIVYKNYFNDFCFSQTQKVRAKIAWTLDLIKRSDVIPIQYLKHISGTDGLYEIRVQAAGNVFRIFCFFDKGNIIVLGNGFQKKTQKTPKNEIERAVKIKQDYENEKYHIL